MKRKTARLFESGDGAASLFLKTLDAKDHDLLAQVVDIYCHIPAAWVDNFTPDQRKPAQMMRQLTEGLRTGNLHVLLLMTEHQDIVGLHWLSINTEGIGQVDATWIASGFRKMGLAARLKRDGEHWFKDHGVSLLQTKVDTANHAMMQLNRKLGYTQDGDRMVKSIADLV